MPLLFSNKFQLPKHIARKKLIFHSENDPKLREHPIVLRLGGQAAEFVNGEWISRSPQDGLHEYEVIKKIAQQLKEENNLLKIKIDILLDMLTEETIKAERKTTKEKQGDITVL